MADESVPPVDFGKKKKKSKNPLAVAEETPAPPVAATPTPTVEKVTEEFNDTTFFDKKKKKRRTVDVAKQLEGGEGSVPMPSEEIFDQLIANNPELATDVRKKLKMPPPLMARVGTKKTQFTNFTIICKSFNRDPSHLSAYLFAELGTNGSIDANGALMIRGKYMAKHIEPLLQSYARNYVKCSTCGSHDTVLSKDARLLFLICKKCNSKVTVKNI
ncbi:unnamed protein product [Hymenolepis diminuta]|uniref:Eukaryotic translation initiation factor 2 subunit 2 n=1 Tax=Hymenolepis diminuta TaxID=6216 RepID=A0A158QFY3_HYMDI|nr:unnamed protein product [Hymenolepis diminuta]